jgi:nitroreductase
MLSRASVSPRLLRDPAPDQATRDLAVSAAACAPDHGRIQPWRFVFIEGDERCTFGDLLADALTLRDPNVPVERVEAERAKPLRAPLVVVAGAALRHDHPNVPVWEQEASAAAGVMNFLNALHALGYGAIWLSSEALRDARVKSALGFSQGDVLLGWIYVGRSMTQVAQPTRPAPALLSRNWAPPALQGV